MRHLVMALLPLLSALIVTASPAAADVATDVRTFCKDENPSQPKAVEQCIRDQLKGANRVGTVLQQHAKDPEVQEIYARCVAKVQKIHNANN